MDFFCLPFVPLGLFLVCSLGLFLVCSLGLFLVCSSRFVLGLFSWFVLLVCSWFVLLTVTFMQHPVQLRIIRRPGAIENHSQAWCN